MNDDQRIEAILELIMNLAAGNLTARAEQSEAGDTIDGVIEGLNMLAEELTHSVETGKFFEALAYHDYLTKLPNRVLFEERLTHACARVKRTESHLVLLFLDLNEFKPINDQWGHHVGDLMLKHVAKQMNT